MEPEELVPVKYIESAPLAQRIVATEQVKKKRKTRMTGAGRCGKCKEPLRTMYITQEGGFASIEHCVYCTGCKEGYKVSLTPMATIEVIADEAKDTPTPGTEENGGNAVNSG